MAGAVAAAVARQEEERSPALMMRQAIENQRTEFARGLPAHVDVDRFIRGALNALHQTPALARCTRESVLIGLSQAAQLGLEVNDVRGQAYLIPRKNRRRDERTNQWFEEEQATLQLGWKGLVDLAARSGIIVDCDDIRDADEFDIRRGTEATLIHRPKLGRRGEPLGYYAVAHFAGGRTAFEVMSKEEVEDHRDKFATQRDYNTKAVKGPWVDHFDAMARKTVIRKLLNRLPQAVEFARADAIETDGYDDPPAIVPVRRVELPANVDAVTGEIGTGVPEERGVGDAAEREPVESVEPAAATQPHGVTASPTSHQRQPPPKETPAEALSLYGDVTQPDCGMWGVERWKEFIRLHGTTQSIVLRHASILAEAAGVEPPTALSAIGPSGFAPALVAWVEGGMK